MEIKKNPIVALENYSKFFMLLGLSLSLLVVYLALEHESSANDSDLRASVSLVNLDLENENIPITPPPETTPPPEPQQPQSIMDKIEIVKDEKKIIETVLKSTEIGEKDAIIIKDPRLTSEIVEVVEKEEVVEDVPFAIIEEAPIFPGCTGSREERKICLSDKVSKHVHKEFNANLAQELGLAPGKQKIYIIFTIDKNGDVANILARATHKSLEKEAIRVINLLPKMTPGKQRNRPVGVKYSLPITFNVE
ncbi:MAG: energy transducer TonB [Flavobacteriaceae bacterium]|nr:energy transducer TonB [Flavobacteriaceae bacterium]